MMRECSTKQRGGSHACQLHAVLQGQIKGAGMRALCGSSLGSLSQYKEPSSLVKGEAAPSHLQFPGSGDPAGVDGTLDSASDLSKPQGDPSYPLFILLSANSPDA